MSQEECGDILNYAYDTYLETVVSADCVKVKSNEEPYRFICACCGQDVIIAAQESDSQTVHFRHKHGNNDTECEKYLGRYGVTGLSKSIKHFYKDRQIDFYFSAHSKRIYLGIKFTDEELTEYQKSNSLLTIKCNRKSDPFLSKEINKTNFSSNHTERIGINIYSNEYFVGIDNKAYRMYAVLKQNIPAFFKLSESDTAFARYVKGETIYTQSVYYVLLPSGNKAEIALKKISSIEVLESFTFRIDPYGETIYAVKVCFTQADDEVIRLLQKWEKQIINPSTLDLIWPPAFEYDEKTYANSDTLFFYSSFQFEPKKNINVSDDKRIERLSNSLILVTNSSSLKIMRNNVEFSFILSEHDYSYNELTPKVHQTDRVYIPRQGEYYLFSDSGTQKLFAKQNVYLTPDSYIREYKNSYLMKTILFQGYTPLSAEPLLYDILSNYHVLVPFDGAIDDMYPEFLLDYLQYCKAKGMINAAVVRCMKEKKF